MTGKQMKQAIKKVKAQKFECSTLSVRIGYIWLYDCAAYCRFHAQVLEGWI